MLQQESDVSAELRNLAWSSPAFVSIVRDVIYTRGDSTIQMKIVFMSTHTDQIIGYSKVAYNMLKQLATLAPRVKTFHFGFQRHQSMVGMRKLPAGIIQYDAAANEDPKEEGFGFNKVQDYLEMVNPDIVMVYNDPLIVNRFIEAMKHDKNTSQYKLWVYLDQVYDGIPTSLLENINNHADRIYSLRDIWRQRHI